MENHEINVSITRLGKFIAGDSGVWEIRIRGITSGAEINFGDGDTGSIIFRLDASRFKPFLTKGNT